MTMKKLILVVCAVGVSLMGYAQMQSGLTHRQNQEAKTPAYHEINGQKAEVSEWYNYVDEVASVSSGNAYFTILFPDSNVVMEYSNGYFPTNWHSMGQVFDPKGSLWFSHSNKLDSNDAYVIDSIAIPYRYFRYKTAKADTLIVQIFKHDKLLNYSLTSNSRRFKTGEYDFTTKRGTNVSQTIKEVLDFADTAASAKFLEYALNISVNPSEVVGVALTFISGNPHNAGDTIYSTSATVANKVNRFDQFYYSDPGQLYADGYFNSGLLVPAEVRYNTGTSWDGIFISGIAYTNYINHNINFKITTATGVEKLGDAGFSVEQNYPNPFSSVSFVNYSIAKASMVNVEVYDITGKSVMSMNEGMKNAGSYKVAIDASGLENGVYYYTFRTDYGQVTKKMLIQH